MVPKQNQTEVKALAHLMRTTKTQATQTHNILADMDFLLKSKQ